MLPHEWTGLSIAILSTANRRQKSHGKPETLLDGAKFDLELLNGGLAGPDTSLVGEDDDAVAINDETPKLRWYPVVPELPIVMINGEEAA